MPKGNTSFSIAVFRGDGIGPEVMDPCTELLSDLGEQSGEFRLLFTRLEAGAGQFRCTGTALPDEGLRAAGEADAVLLGAMGDPQIRYPDGQEVAPQVDMREHFELFAGVRPIRTYPGMPVL